jgi:transposase-like protein
MIRRRTYAREFKEPAIDLYRSQSGEKTTKEIADELGIHQENLCRRRRESKEGKKVKDHRHSRWLEEAPFKEALVRRSIKN